MLSSDLFCLIFFLLKIYIKLISLNLSLSTNKRSRKLFTTLSIDIPLFVVKIETLVIFYCQRQKIYSDKFILQFICLIDTIPLNHFLHVENIAKKINFSTYQFMNFAFYLLLQFFLNIYFII